MKHYTQSLVTQSDEKKSYQIIKKVLETEQLCLHDIDNIVSILESMNQPEILEAFILYLDEKSPNLSKVVFR